MKKPSRHVVQKSFVWFEILGVVALLAALGITITPATKETFEGIQAARAIQQRMEMGE